MGSCILTIEVESKLPICIMKDGNIEFSSIGGGKNVAKIICQEDSLCEVEIIQFINQRSDSIHSVVGSSDIYDNKETSLFSLISSNYYVHCFVAQRFALNIKKDSSLVILVESILEEYANKQYISYPKIYVVKDKNHVIRVKHAPTYFPSKKVNRQLFIFKASLPLLATLFFLVGIALFHFWIYNTMDGAMYIYEGELVFSSFFFRHIVAPLGTMILLLSYIVYQWTLWVKFKEFVRNMR